MSPDPRPAPPRTTEDLQFKIRKRPNTFEHSTADLVDYLRVFDKEGMLCGYLWASRDGQAAGYVAAHSAGDVGENAGVKWYEQLRRAKAAETGAMAVLEFFLDDSSISDHWMLEPTQEPVDLQELKQTASTS